MEDVLSVLNWISEKVMVKEVVGPILVVCISILINGMIKNVVHRFFHIDKKKPEIRVLEDTLVLPFAEEYDFKNNLEVTFGTSGGTVTCDPSNNNYLGTEDQEITCIATGRNGLETTVTFQVKREQ